MRGVLDRLYQASGALAALCLAAIAVVVLAQVAANLIDTLWRWASGTPIGLVIPSYAEFAGFFLAAASFFALAYTLRHGGHIRVTLALQALPPRPRRLAEVWCLAVATTLAGYFAVYMVRLCLESWHFADMSTGMVAVPIWIPQSAMALGLVVLTIALADELVSVLAGRRPAYERGAGGILARTPPPRTSARRDGEGT